MTNRVCRLKSRPFGMTTRDNFEIADEPMPTPGPGEFRVKVHAVSLDPAMRGWMSEGRSYVPPVQIGEVMRAYAAGIVEESNHDGYRPGDAVMGLFGVQEHAVSDGTFVHKIDPAQAPMERWVGGLGMPGWTAYFGTMEILYPEAGQTLVVSAASGAVGSLVGQIGKLRGATVIGIAGGAEKCRYITGELGFDAAIDYKSEDVAKRLAELTPDRVHMYFENVGGKIGNAVMHRMATFGRVAVCGLISSYNETDPAKVGYDAGAQRSILVNRLKIQGFIVFDFAKQMREAIGHLGKWHAEGKLKMREDVREGGVDAFPDTLNMLYTGENFGKLVLKL